MKLPAFDYAKMQWDAWQAFHVVPVYGRFVQFDTSEFVVSATEWHPLSRRNYAEFDIRICSTVDKECPRLRIPGIDRPVPKSRLVHGGQQVLLLDYGHKRAVSVDRYIKDRLIPQRFHKKVSAYYAGFGAPPIGSPVNLRYLQPLSAAQHRHLRTLRDACKVWLAMQPRGRSFEAPSGVFQFSGSWLTRGLEIPVPVLEFADGKELSSLTELQRINIALANYSDLIVHEQHPWLTFD